MRDFGSSLIEIVRRPPDWIYEALELTEQGRCYLYRYNPVEGIFYRATVPAGAAQPHFRRLKGSELVPLGGWMAVEKIERPKRFLQLVSPSRPTSA